ncbi:3-deoxy-8-phosphooctulonate synthase [Gammaproteobacteria bacterium]|nr:3-deoxy-8-phosphooctulonate synthase [Gammaproteobacteria bacterium]
MKAPKVVKVGPYTIANNRKITILAGPCALESRTHALEMALALKEIADRFDVGMIYKSSYDKANRTSVSSNRGIGIKGAMPIFSEIKEVTGLPVVTDVHNADDCNIVGKVVDVIQIPAFLCRQTDLLVAAGQTGRAVNIKKGQFLAPWDMINVLKKVESTGNKNIMLCERGATFGYNTLVSDMKSLAIMAKTGYPVIFDATHSVQQPGGQGDTSGGDREFAPLLARAAVAVGVAGVFMETHQEPDSAPSDGPNMIYLNKVAGIIETLLDLDAISKKNPVIIS